MNSDNENPRQGGQGADDAVGYKKPPKKSQFKPGQSGNKKGRTKGHRNLRTIFKEQLECPMAIKENGKTKKVSKAEAMFMILMNRALEGNPTAIANVMKTAERYRIGEEPPPPDSFDFEQLTYLQQKQLAWLLDKVQGRGIWSNDAYPTVDDRMPDQIEKDEKEREKKEQMKKEQHR
jgi:hypothetical protein